MQGFFGLAAVMTFRLALGVGDSGDVVGYETDTKHEHDAEYIAARFPLDRNGVLPGLEVGLEDFPRDGRVENDQQKKRDPEDAHEDEVGCFVPLQPQFVFKFHAFYVCDLPHRLVGEDHVGNGDKQHEDPHGRRQEFAVSH